MAGAHDNNWMPLYVGDYLRDTSRLTVAEHGAYLLLIMDYWVNGPPLDDDRELARITRTPLSTWRRYRRGTLIKLFDAKGGRWFHKRIEAELTHSRELNEKKRRGGLASAASRRSRNGTAQPEHRYEHRSEHRPQPVRDCVRTPLPSKEEGLAPKKANPNFLTTRDASSALPSQGDAAAALRSKRGRPPEPEPSSDSFITPEEKAAALVELHREIRAKAAIMTGIVEA